MASNSQRAPSVATIQTAVRATSPVVAKDAQPAATSPAPPEDDPRTPLAASGPTVGGSAAPVASTSTLAPLLGRRTSCTGSSPDGTNAPLRQRPPTTMPIDIAAPSSLAPMGHGPPSRTPSPSPSASSTRSSPRETPIVGSTERHAPVFGSSLSPTLPQHHFATSAPTPSQYAPAASTSGRSSHSGSGAGSARMTNGYSHSSSNERTPVLGYSTNERPQQQQPALLATSAGPAYHVGFGAPTPSHQQQQGAVLLSQYLAHTYLPSIMPSPQEYAEKQSTRQSLEALAKTVLPGCSLVAFGSTANGLSLRNSDMDLCCVMADGSPLPRSASELVEAVGSLIQSGTNYHVRMLPRARIPIIKLTIPPSMTSPLGMACDIGFGNQLAIANTNLLLTYVMCDARLRTMVLFIKIWTKRRKINNPYLGTLSSYGYALLVIFYLAHVRRPPVLPNLQRISPASPSDITESTIDGHDTYFYKDIQPLTRAQELRRSWPPVRNQENVGELLIGFFSYMARDFRYQTDVVSIRSENGLIAKDAKGWHQDIEVEGDAFGRKDNTRFCIEDPFQLNYNVARTVTRDGVYTIRGEFIRASRLLLDMSRADRPAALVAELCEEREEGLIVCPPGASFNGRRQSAPSPQVPNSLVSPQAAAEYRLWAAANGIADGPPGGRPGQLPLRTSNMPPVFDESALSATSETLTMPMPPPRVAQPGSSSSSTYVTSPRMRQRPSQQQPNGMPSFRRRESGNAVPTTSSVVSSTSASATSSPAMAHEQLPRSSIDGLSEVDAESLHRYFSSPAAALGMNLGPPLAHHSWTAPTSPVLRPQHQPPGAQRYNGGQVGGAASASYRAPRSQSHSASDRARYVPRPPPVWGTLVSPSHVTGLGLFDDNRTQRRPVAPPDQSMFKRTGPARIDDREIITFGDLRLERQQTPRVGERRLASDGSADATPNARSLAAGLAALDVVPRRPHGPASVP